MSQEKKQVLSSKSKGKLFIKSETDRISELPDDILDTILDHFHVKDAAKTTVLSSRWRHVCAFKSRLNFDVRCMFRPDLDEFVVHKANTGICQSYKDTFVRGVNQFLQYYQGSELLIFRVSFCLDQNSTCDIDQWVTFAVRMGPIYLYLRLSCADCYRYDKTSCHSRKLYMLRSELLSHGNMAKVERLFLRSCILGPGVANQFSSLTFLQLMNVILGADQVETILSCCLNLETLVLGDCTLIPILCIPGSLHRLKILVIINCSGVEEIKLSATNLTRFDYDGDSHKFSFSGATNLKQVFFRARDGQKMQYVFSQLAKDHPLVEIVSVYSTANWVHCLPEQISTFRRVKLLEFFSPTKVIFDVLKIIAILKACPFMEKFYLVMLSVDAEQETPGPPMPFECVHKYLKDVHIGGFHFRASYIEFAIYVLEYGVALERMVIDPKLQFYYGADDWLGHSRITWDEGERAKVCSRLQDHPKSSVIIIE